MANSNDRFNDLFHDFGDDADVKEDEYVDFDNLYQNIHQEDNITIIQDDTNTNIHPVVVEEQQHLSQKLSQLSTSDEQQQGESKQSTTMKKRLPLTPTTPVATTKKLKTTDIVEEEQASDEMPPYLSSNNPTFEQLIQSLQRKCDNSIHIEELRQIACLKHKLALLRLKISLWTTYLYSGTSQLKEHEEEEQQQQQPGLPPAVHPYLSVWPKELESTMMTDRTANFKNNDLNYHTYLNYVNKMLQKFKDQHSYYQAQLNERKEDVKHCFNTKIEEAIDQFVEQHGILLQRIPIEGKIAIIKFDYNDRLINMEFHRQLLYQHQIETFDKLTQSKLDREISKMEVALLKQRLAHNYLPTTIDTLRIPPPPSELLDVIINETTRRRLTDRYDKIIQRTKSDMMMVYISAAEAKMNQFKMKFDTDMAQMKQDQRHASPDKIFSDIMLDILERRFKNINERLLCLYNLKIHFFANAPTMIKN